MKDKNKKEENKEKDEFEIFHKTNNKVSNNNTKNKIIQLAKSPSPIRIGKKPQNFSTNRLNSNKIIHKKNSSTNKIENINVKPFNTIENQRRNRNFTNLTTNTTPTRQRKNSEIF